MLVVYGIFAFQNPFNNAKITAIRGVIAVVMGWVVVILTSLLVSKIDMSTVSAAIELADLQARDNARMLRALFFGWAYPLIFIELIWATVFLYRYSKKNNYLNFRMLKS